MKSNRDYGAILIGMVIMVIILISAILLSSCSAIVKDAKAIDRVQSSTKLTKVILDQYPCNNDTIITYDTTVMIDERIDTVKDVTYYRLDDTVYVQDVKVVTRWKEKIRTVEKLTTNDRQEKLLTSQLAAMSLEKAQLKDKLSISEGMARKHALHKWITWVLLAIGAGVGLWLKFWK